MLAFFFQLYVDINLFFFINKQIFGLKVFIEILFKIWFLNLF